jgi:hypothetical protein
LVEYWVKYLWRYEMSAETLVLEQEVEELDKDSAIFLAVLFVLALYAITGSQVVLAAITTLGLIYIVPVDKFRKMFGYRLFLDVAFGWWLISVASITLGGFTVATITGLMYTVLSFELMAMMGAERLSINGEVGFSKGLAALLGQGIAWSKAFLAGLKTGHVEAPTPLQWAWVEIEPAGGFKATQTYKAFAKLRHTLVG